MILYPFFTWRSLAGSWRESLDPLLFGESLGPFLFGESLVPLLFGESLDPGGSHWFLEGVTGSTFIWGVTSFWRESLVRGGSQSF